MNLYYLTTTAAMMDGQQMLPKHLRHCTSPALAVLLAPAEPTSDAVIWELTPEHEYVRMHPVPVYTLEQRVTFAINCAMDTTPAPAEPWLRWARAWLDGTDRTAEAARAAWAAAWEARAAAWAAGAAEARAAAWAAGAAEAAADAGVDISRFVPGTTT